MTLLVATHTTYAHDLLPKQLIQFMKENPQATDQQIQDFLSINPAIYQNNPHFKSNMLYTIRHPDHSFWHNGYDFIKLGLGHILSGPDHILFVLSILLVFVSLKDVLKLASVFTISHSITLILAGSNLVRVSSRVVEPMIALSIAYMAITSVFLRHRPFFRSAHSKASTVFFFGLFHGLGFAGLLKDLGIPENRFISSLLSFNIGIELGQILIIFCALPIIYAFRNKLWYPRAIQFAAVLIAILGFGWAFQRIFL